MKKTLLSFGHGYSAQALSKLLIADRWHVIGTTRSSEKALTLAQQGVEPLIWPGSDMADALSRATHVLHSVAPNEDGDPVFAELSDALKRAKHLAWFGYLSTTGVYGDHAGGWVDETTPLAPSTRRGEMRKAAEEQWQSLDLPLHIFRLAGIFGPGRGPFSKVRNRTARRIIKPGQVFSRTHVEDIAQVLYASIQHPKPDSVYNVCDDDPAPPEDVIEYAADLLGLPVPPAIDWEAAEMTPMARSFYAESKKVRNDLIKKELGVTLKYPDYRSGLQALLRQEDDAGDQ